MNARVRRSLTILLIIAIGFFAIAKRSQFAARIWHWRYGDFTTMGNYQIPVPEHWIAVAGNSEEANLSNMVSSRPKDAKFHSNVFIQIAFGLNDPRLGGLDSWLALSRKQTESRNGKITEEKRLDIAGDAAACIGGTGLQDKVLSGIAAAPYTDIVFVECKSDHLYIRFLGEPSDLPTFYSLVSLIRRSK